jgi:UPF0271 protein
MSDTGGMATVDINADLGEGESVTSTDLAVLDAVTSASLACGFHAGSRRVMRDSASACLDRGVVIGAHVSFRDRSGFGRRAIPFEHDQLVSDIVEQCATLRDEVAPLGATVEFVKPHGALYNSMSTDPTVAACVVEAMSGQRPAVLVAQPRAVVVALARQAGLTVVLEGFPDRGYLADGRLAPRGEAGALVSDDALVAQRALSLVRRHGLDAVDGSWTAVEAYTICIHGDSPGAARTAKAVRDALAADGVSVSAFIGRTAAP